METVVEYLIIFQNKSSFCDTPDRLLTFMQSDSSLRIDGTRIFQGSSCFSYQILSGEIDERQRYFQMKFWFESENDVSVDAIETFSEFLRTIRGLLRIAQGELFELRDDISLFYSKKAYVIIHDIENLLRRLITNFLLIKVGKEWTKETTQGDLSRMRDAKARSTSNFLYSLDFIQINTFLFTAYSSSKEDIFKKLKSAKTIDDFEFARSLIPRSNWERYFAGIVNCPDDWLESRWEKIYLLRNLVAHNAEFTRMYLQELSQLIDQVKPKLDDALQKLSEIIVPEGDRQSVTDMAEIVQDAAVFSEEVDAGSVMADLDLARAERRAYEPRIDGREAYERMLARESYMDRLISSEIFGGLATRAVNPYRDLFPHSRIMTSIRALEESQNNKLLKAVRAAQENPLRNAIQKAQKLQDSALPRPLQGSNIISPVPSVSPQNDEVNSSVPSEEEKQD